MKAVTARVLFGAGMVLTATVGASVAASTASASPGAVGPDQTFYGLVNGDQASATVVVDCPQGLQPGERGHPAAGQTMAVKWSPTSKTPGGFTGARGKTIVAQFAVTGADRAAQVTFSHYGSEALATTLWLPCLGSGTLDFSARPTSSTARTETLNVNYVTPCPGVCAAGRGGLGHPNSRVARRQVGSMRERAISGRQTRFT